MPAQPPMIFSRPTPPPMPAPAPVLINPLGAISAPAVISPTLAARPVVTTAAYRPATPAFAQTTVAQPAVLTTARPAATTVAHRPWVYYYPPAPVIAPVYAPPVYAAPVYAPPVVVAPPAPVVVASPVIPAPVYVAPAPVMRARTIVRPWGARTVIRYW
jgi:hypothetical protein